MSVQAVLLVPHPVHEGLLTGGVCGSRPPRVHRWVCASLEHSMWSPEPRSIGCGCGTVQRTAERALVLAWSAAGVPSGIFRAWYAAADVGWEPLGDLLYEQYTLAELATFIDAWGLGTIVLLDENGSEISP